MNRIVQDERQWISEDGRSLFERDPMLAEVRSGFARVPGEAHTTKCMTLNEPDHNSEGYSQSGSTRGAPEPACAFSLTWASISEPAALRSGVPDARADADGERALSVQGAGAGGGAWRGVTTA